MLVTALFLNPIIECLQLLAGNKSFDATWAAEYSRFITAHWRSWANDKGRYCDVERKQTVSQMLRLGFAISYWMVML